MNQAATQTRTKRMVAEKKPPAKKPNAISFLMLSVVHRCAKFSRSRRMMFCHFRSTHSDFPPNIDDVKRKHLQSSICTQQKPGMNAKSFRRSNPLSPRKAVPQSS
jgi:hypothetical protein